MGAYLNKPVTEKHTETGEGAGIKYGACSMQGWRVNQEVCITFNISIANRMLTIVTLIWLKDGVFLLFMMDMADQK